MYNVYEMLLLIPITLFWLIMLINPMVAFKLSLNKKYKNPTPKRILFARIYLTLLVLTFAIVFYFTDFFSV